MPYAHFRTTLWRRLLLPSLCAVLAAGCGGGSVELVPVTGVVTLDGQPVANAIVQFQPTATPDPEAPVPASFGTADASGRFELKTKRDEPGAVVGQHQVTISSRRPPQDGGNDSGIGRVAFKDPIPAKYNTATELTFDVPEGGTTTADFNLTSP